MKKLFIPNKYWFFLALALCLPAFLINLGLLTLNEDESIRALVALEMRLSGDYFTPTLNNTLYFSKPPLYNWILNLSYTLIGQINELSLRVPTMFFLGLFAWSIYHYSNKYYNQEFAFINAMIFITCGRVLFWDSMLGYIDICYSWVTYVELMVIFHCYQRKEFRKLFLLSYFLAALGFMLKGFPTILFQGLSLLAFLFYKKDLRRLFSKDHMLGLLIFMVIVGGYYVYYFSVNPDNSAFEGLLDQSVRRTVLHEKHSLRQLILHIIWYPFQNIYDFLPWSIMIIYIFRKDLLEKIFSDDFLRYCAIIFGINIIVYWTSVEVYPRYILMLVPILFTIFLYFHKVNYEEDSVQYKIFVYFSLSVILIAAGLSIAFMFIPELNEVQLPYLKSIGVGLPLFLLAYYFYNNKSQRFIVLICALLLTRIGFNFFVLPDRFEHDKATKYKKEALAVGEKYKDKDLRLYESSKVDYTSSFYISSTRNQITQRDYEHTDADAFYIIDTSKYVIPEDFQVIETFQNRERDKVLSIVKIEE